MEYKNCIKIYIHFSKLSKLFPCRERYVKMDLVSTISTFLAKFVFSSSFLVPVILLSLDSAFIASIIWGILLILIFSYILAKQQKESPFKVIGEHLLIVVVVLVVTHLTGDLISTHFK